MSTTLIITGDILDLAGITASLKLQPQQVWRKGERKSFRGADGQLREFKSIHEWSGWKRWLEEPFTELDTFAQLKHWAGALKPHTKALQLLKQQGANIVIDCCISTSKTVAVDIPSELQLDLGALGVDLEISFYALKPGV